MPYRAALLGCLLAIAAATAAEPEASAGDPFAGFSAWRQQRAGVPAAADAHTLEEGRRLAVARRAALARLIRSDPRAAVRAALDPAEIAALPPALRELCERRVAGRGSFAVVSLCEHGEGEEHRCRIVREVRIGEATYTAHLPAGTAALSLEAAIIDGVALDGELALAEAPAAEPVAAPAPAPDGDIAAAGPTLNPSAPPAGPAPPTIAYNEYTGTNSHQFGPKTIMVMLVQPSDGATWTSPPSFATLDGQTSTASQWWFNVSYGLTWFGPKYRFPGTASEILIPRLVVTPVLKLPLTASAYLSDFGRLQSDSKAAVEAQGGTWTSNGMNDPDHYDRWVVMSNTKMISSTGLAYVGGKFAWTGGSISGGVAQHEHGQRPWRIRRRPRHHGRQRQHRLQPAVPRDPWLPARQRRRDRDRQRYGRHLPDLRSRRSVCQEHGQQGACGDDPGDRNHHLVEAGDARLRARGRHRRRGFARRLGAQRRHRAQRQHLDQRRRQRRQPSPRHQPRFAPERRRR
jgi:hypothetical protein